jgi:hypothetical protein
MDFGSFALEVLIKGTDTGGSSLWTRDDTGTGERSFRLTTDGTTGYVHFLRTPSTNIVGATNVMDGNLHHVVANYDGTTLELWVDGVVDASGSVGALSASGARLMLAGLYTTGWGTDSFTDFHGRMQHAAVYTHTLSPARIAAHVAAAGL